MPTNRTTVGPLATPEGRLAFPHLNEPETTGNYPSGKYCAMLLIPKATSLRELADACVRAAQLSWPAQGITVPSQLKMPFKNGDDKDLENFPGHWYITCKTKNKPPCVDRFRNPMHTPPKGGDYCVLSVTAGAFKMNVAREIADALRSAGHVIVDGRDDQGRPQLWRPAVTLYLNAVQLKREGEAFGAGGGTSAFSADEPEVSPAVAQFGVAQFGVAQGANAVPPGPQAPRGANPWD